MSRPWRPTARRTQPRGFLRKAFDLLLAVVILALMALIAARFERVETRHMAGAAVVNDGDTITIDGERIRLRGIDAPEFSQTCRRAGGDYACGREAREALRRLIGRQAVACAGWQRDRFGRLLGDCTAGETDLNRALVNEGWAVAFGSYEAEELSARNAKRGLWAGEFARPGQWRDSHGDMAEDDHGRLNAGWSWLRDVLGLAPAI